MKTLVAMLLCAFAVAASAEETLKFQINSYRVEGNTVLADERIQAALVPFTGSQRDFADVQRALETLEGMYRKAGFGALQVYLPEQELNKGIVVFKVVETKVGKVRIEGNQYFGADNIRRALPDLKEETVPNTQSIAKDLHLANESPSRHLGVSLQASDDPQHVDVDIKAEDEKPWRLFTSVDNTGTSAGRGRGSIGYQNSDMFDRDQVFTAQGTTSLEEPSKVKIFGAGYNIPIYTLGDSLSFYGGYSNVTSGTVESLFNVSGKGDVAGARYTHALPTLGDYQEHLQFGYDWRRFETALGDLTNGSSRYIVNPLSLTYLGQWQGARWSYDWNVGESHNFSNADLAQSAQRIGAKGNYSIFRYGGNLYFTVAQAWTLHAALAGQWSSDALPSGEQYGIGGATSVRGYEERVVADDSGQTVNLEAYTPDFATHAHWKDMSLRGVVFGDYGRVTRNDAQPGELNAEELAGVGMGMRLSIGKTATVRFDVARAMKAGGGTEKGDVRAHVLATVSY